MRQTASALTKLLFLVIADRIMKKVGNFQKNCFDKLQSYTIFTNNFVVEGLEIWRLDYEWYEGFNKWTF